jgi:hypothetical protein
VTQKYDDQNFVGENSGVMEPQSILPSTVAWRFRQVGLVPPPVPKSMESRLTAYGEWFFATFEPSEPPYIVEDYLDALVDQWPEDRLLIAHDGHGINSWAMHYFLVLGPLACFLQLPWGGAEMDEELNREMIADAFAHAEALIEAGYAGEDRLIVVDTFAGQAIGKWAVNPDDVEWQEFNDPMAEAVKRVGTGAAGGGRGSNVIIPV